MKNQFAIAEKKLSTVERQDKISVIVPVRNEKKYIEGILNQLVHQSISKDKLEIIVADGQSIDNTVELVKKFADRYPFVKLLTNSKKIASSGRNICIQHSTGSVVVVVDGHCDLNNQYYLSHILELFRLSNADCLGRPQPLDGNCSTFTQKAIALARKSWMGHNPSSLIFSGGNVFSDPSSVAVAYKRSGLQQCGLFDERFDACEDVELNHRILNSNMVCFFSDAIQLKYVPRDSLIGLFRQMHRYGRGRIRLIRKHSEAFSSTLCAPLVPLTLLVTVFFSFACFSLLLVPCLVILACYVLLLASESLRIIAISKVNPYLILLITPVIVIIHLGIAAGMTNELFTGILLDREK